MIDGIDINSFFKELNKEIKAADKAIQIWKDDIVKVAYGNNVFTDRYLKTEKSFFQIIIAITIEGMDFRDYRVVEVLKSIVERKINFTKRNSAWEQYDHLANWLIYLASILEIEGTLIEEVFLEAVLHSMNTMSKERQLGFSWQAYESWSTKWTSISVTNRNLIKGHINKNSMKLDAKSIVNC